MKGGFTRSSSSPPDSQCYLHFRPCGVSQEIAPECELICLETERDAGEIHVFSPTEVAEENSSSGPTLGCGRLKLWQPVPKLGITLASI